MRWAGGLRRRIVLFVFLFPALLRLPAPAQTSAATSQSNATPQTGIAVSKTGASIPQSSNSVPGNEACSSCHAEIYKSYSKTIMAQASGPAAEGLITGEFEDDISGVQYRIYEKDGRVWMSYKRERELSGQRELRYFIGSGKKGRTYLFPDDGYLFEAPINWYTREKRWNMTPAYMDAQEIPMNLPAFESCLNCHTSGMQTPMPGTANKFAGKPFLHNGITCERCHGAGDGHIAGKGTIVNPAKLPPERRDSICMECHFEGATAVEQPGKRVYEFQPGDRLSDYIHYFVLRQNEPDKPEALSQFQALSMSACKKKSGDRMWCGSCHDSHEEPAEAEKAAYYRRKCLNCHRQAFAASHHPEKPDCISCHMPSLPSADVAHTEGTDHRIRRYPQMPELITRVPGPTLESFPQDNAAEVTNRDLALGWYSLAQRGMQGAEGETEKYLGKAIKDRPDDPDVLEAWAFVEQKHGHRKDAELLYAKVLKGNPLSNTADTNLGILEARGGNIRDAVKLWQAAFSRVPYRSEIGVDLAIVFCADGQKDIARKYLDRVMEFNPDYGKAKGLMEHMKGDSGECKP